MKRNQLTAKNLYQRRVEKEGAITEDEISDRAKWHLPILSNNYKCSVSLDLPLKNCVPTKICQQVCYAAQGRQFYRKSVVKSLAVDRLILDDPEHVARKMIDESAGRIIRIAGSGELLPKQTELMTYLEQLGGQWWGFTRRPDTHRSAPSLMFSFDATTPARAMKYVQESVPPDRRAYLRRPEDPASPIEVVVTFPVHGPMTAYTTKVEPHYTDCPFDRSRVEGCWSCQRCY